MELAVFSREGKKEINENRHAIQVGKYGSHWL